MITHSQSASSLFVMLQGSVGCCYQNFSHMPWEGPIIIFKIKLAGFLIELPDLD